ncbi:MAG: CPBP family intramembrane glutamic endopeptidase [Anaerolineales bacterium]
MEKQVSVNKIPRPYTLLVILVLLVFCFLFLLTDNTYYRFASSIFPVIDNSSWLATLWGLFSRLHLLLIIIPLVVWRPRLFGFQIGKIYRHWRTLLVFLILNCGIVAAYFLITGSSSPYSGNQWFFSEVVTVPIVEEIFWRGLVFAALLAIFRRMYDENASAHLSVWSSGVAFGLLHAGNALAGVPLAFVAIQTLSAVIWGVLYGYARAKTDSIYPAMFLHAAMNLVVVLF